MKTRIYYHHTDCGGVVYYANYLNFLEEARTEYFALKGASIKQLADSGTMFVVARQEVDYKLPAVYGDELDIITHQNKQLIVKAKTILVCVDKHLKPQAIPQEVRSKIS
jgi:acyl-CoA thioester hydrolase